jgi:hypothetical protein
MILQNVRSTELHVVTKFCISGSKNLRSNIIKRVSSQETPLE